MIAALCGEWAAAIGFPASLFALGYLFRSDSQRFRRSTKSPADEAKSETVLGRCQHGVDLDREFCPDGCRV